MLPSKKCCKIISFGVSEVSILCVANNAHANSYVVAPLKNRHTKTVVYLPFFYRLYEMLRRSLLCKFSTKLQKKCVIISNVYEKMADSCQVHESAIIDLLLRCFGSTTPKTNLHIGLTQESEQHTGGNCRADNTCHIRTHGVHQQVV